MLRPTVHLLNQRVLVYSPQICPTTTSSGAVAAGTHGAWETLLKAVDFSGQLEPKSLGCKTSCPSLPFLEFHESGATVSGQESWKVSVCFRKCRHLGPPATCLLPKGRTITCKQRSGGQERKGDTAISSWPHSPLCEELPRRNPGQAAVLLLEEKVFPFVSISSSNRLVSSRARGQEVPNSLSNFAELTSQHPKESRAMEG